MIYKKYYKILDYFSIDFYIAGMYNEIVRTGKEKNIINLSKILYGI